MQCDREVDVRHLFICFKVIVIINAYSESFDYGLIAKIKFFCGNGEEDDYSVDLWDVCDVDADGDLYWNVGRKLILGVALANHQQ